MKKIAILFLALVAISCQTSKDEMVFKGSIDADDGTAVYLATLGENGQPEPIDTATVKDGEFKLDLPKVDFQTLNVVTIDKAPSNLLFINENQGITATVYKDSLRTSKIDGGEENKYFQDYVDGLMESNKKYGELQKKYSNPEMLQDPAVMKKAKEEQQVIADGDIEKRKEMVKNHKNSLVSVLVLSDMLNTKLIPSNEVHELFNSLSDEAKNTAPGKSMETALDKMSVTEIGNKAPDFSAPTPEGKTLALKDALGKITIVDFWASWCKPCRRENPNLVRVYEKYHDKGLNILGVSLDKEGSKDKWIKAIEDDNLTWPQVSNLKFWKGPIAQQYSIRSIPFALILDENGKIIAKNVRGDALDKKIGELLQ